MIIIESSNKFCNLRDQWAMKIAKIIFFQFDGFPLLGICSQTSLSIVWQTCCGTLVGTWESKKRNSRWQVGGVRAMSTWWHCWCWVSWWQTVWLPGAWTQEGWGWQVCLGSLTSRVWQFSRAAVVQLWLGRVSQTSRLPQSLQTCLATWDHGHLDTAGREDRDLPVPGSRYTAVWAGWSTPAWGHSCSQLWRSRDTSSLLPGNSSAPQDPRTELWAGLGLPHTPHL